MKRRLTTIAVLLCLAICSAVAVFTVSANAAVWSEVDIAEVYAYGDTFEVPERTLTVGSTEVRALHTVSFPGGGAVRGKSVKLSETGNYTVRYYANIGKDQYSTEEKFTVQGFGYKADSEESSVLYGNYTEFGADSTGLIVKLANGDKLTFTKLINVADLTQSDALFKFFITPEHQGAADFNKLTLTLTDSVDSSEYLKIDVNRGQFSSGGVGVSWVMAGGNGQDMVGYEKGKKLHVNDDIGTALYISFVAQNNSGDGWSGPAFNVKPDLRYGAISFDYNTKIVYANADIVSDLDSSDYYKDLWRGWSSGKARLTVSASGYSGATANFCITEVFGMTADELRDNNFVDAESPEITVDGDYTEMPRAEVGRAYPVPEAYAYDDYAGNCEVTSEVVYGYHTEFPVSVSVSGGSFVPDRTGTYTIVYTAKDGFGNTAVKTLFVQAVKTVPDIAIIPPFVSSDVELGTYVEVPEPLVSGGSGKIRIETAVVFDGERTVISGGFRPENEGEYTVEFTATDYIGKTKSATLNVSARRGDKPLFIDSVSLPPVYINGGRYVLPTLYANDYTSGSLERVLCDVKVVDANGERTYKAGGEYIPAVNNNGDFAEITYFSGSAVYPAFNVPVIIGRNENTVYMSNYIYGEKIAVTARDENDALYTTGLAVIPSSGDSDWIFANALLKNEATVTVGTLAGKTNFGAFGFTFIDAANGRKITVTAAIGSAKVTFTHGDESYVLGSSVKNGGKLKITYNNGKINVVCNDSTAMSVPLTVYDDGDAFDGFASDKVYIRVSTTGNKADSRYMVLSVNENTLSYRNQDNSAPSFGILGDYGGKQKINSEYVIRRGVCSDVFAPESSATLTVIAPDGSVMKDNTGKTLKDVPIDEEYVITLSQYGKYTVSYVVTEVNWVGNRNKPNITITVADEEAPVIEFTGTVSDTADVGDVIVLPEYKVTDNLSSEDEISVRAFVINAQGRFIELTDGANAIRCEYAGKYTFIVYATDASGNSSSLTVEVNVK